MYVFIHSTPPPTNPSNSIYSILSLKHGHTNYIYRPYTNAFRPIMPFVSIHGDAEHSLCTVRIFGAPGSDDAFDNFVRSLNRHYTKQKYSYWVYDITDMAYLKCLRYAMPFVKRVLQKNKRLMDEHNRGTAIILSSAAVSSLVQHIMDQVPTKAPRRLFSKADLKANPRAVQEWIETLRADENETK